MFTSPFRPAVAILVLLATVVLTLAGHAGLRAAGGRAAPDRGTSLATTRLLASGEDGLQFALDVPGVEIHEDGSVTVSGLQTANLAAGAPELPSFSTYVALPPGASASVEVTVAGKVLQRPVQQVPPAPQAGDAHPQEDVFRAENPVGLARREASAEIYGSDALFPGTLFRLSEPMYFRDLRVVRIDLFPVQLNPVQGYLEQASRLVVSVSFTDASWQSATPVAGNAGYLESISPMVINFDQALARGWRGLPPAHVESTTVLPTNRDTFKIAVNENGIYELTYQDLRNAGMSEGENPNTFEMMYRGQPVAFQFVGDGDSEFEGGEKIRFYGWAFDGSRLERQFLTENVYWLWAGGTGQRVGSHEGSTVGPVAESFRESLTREPDVAFTHVWTDNWEDAPNEPDAWIWDRVQKVVGDGPVLERVYEITVPVPAQTASAALVTVEILSREPRKDHDVSVYLNGNDVISGTLQWSGARSVNVTMTVPASQLLEGVNEVHVAYHTPVTTTGNSAPALYYMNRITVDYDRHFVASDEQLVFTDGDGGNSYEAAGFSGSQAANALVWEISDRLNPQVVTPDAVYGQGSGPYTYTFGAAPGSATFVATHEGNVRQPLRVEKYVGPDLDPAQGASWVVISHADFLAQAQQLAAHRATEAFGGHSTHVVDVAHVINQYGYGLPLPLAIRHYLQHALADWPVAPQYLLLLGDGHINPRQIPCNAGNTQCQHWATTPETNYVLTDIVFTDQFVGINASDYTFSLLVGSDLLPDLAVGRLAVQTPAEAQNIVDKIVHYETARMQAGAWQRNVLFIADNADTGGDFCEKSKVVADSLPPRYITETVCLEADTEDAIADARIAIHDAVNNPPASGATFLNYRGHGAVRGWAGGLINLDDAGDGWTPWFNNEPLIILSMDCLDGHFAQPGYEALSEEFLAVQNYGSVAHWSSTGFGYDFQHDPLHHSFYDGVFNQSLTVIGDAINYSKLAYILQSHHPSQLYSFTLQGDPAMELIETGFNTFLPALTK